VTIATDGMRQHVVSGGSYVSQATHGSLHSADPGTTGTSEISGGSPAYARKSLTWTAGSTGTATATGVFDVASGTTPAWTGIWNAVTAGTYRDKADIVDQAFSSQGTLTVNYTYTQT
jgi:hypothetical protein